MHRARTLFVAVFILCSAILPAAGARAQSDSSTAVLETVLVVGTQPGPGLWKVSNDRNVLWILATYGPLPSKLIWQSRQVERILAESQEFYTEPGFETYLARGRANARLMQQAMGNGEDVTLLDVLPAEAYEKFSQLNQKYASGAKLDQFRPFIAALELRRRSIGAITLTSDGGVRKTLQRLARRNGVKIRSLTMRDNSYARPAMLEMAAQPPSTDVPCFQSQMERLESDLQQAVVRANAWAVGDIAALRASLQGEVTPQVCADLIRRNSPAQDGFTEAARRADVALRQALQRNRSTLVLMPITSLLNPEGVLSRFRAEGYLVEEPKQ